MLLDNAPVHPHVDSLTTIKLVFLPANTTAGTQPLDAGIIRTFKSIYRKSLVQHMIEHSEDCQEDEMTAGEIIKTLHVSNSINWISQSWDLIQEQTIINCFAHTGIGSRVNVASGSTITQAELNVASGSGITQTELEVLLNLGLTSGLDWEALNSALLNLLGYAEQLNIPPCHVWNEFDYQVLTESE